MGGLSPVTVLIALLFTLLHPFKSVCCENMTWMDSAVQDTLWDLAITFCVVVKHVHTHTRVFALEMLQLSNHGCICSIK